MSSRATHGTPLLETLATGSGSTRSNAVAKITRVDDRKTVPTQPKNHSDMIVMKRNCRTGLPKNAAASRAGYGNAPVGPVPAQYALLAALYQSQPNVFENSRKQMTAAIVVASSAPPIA